VQAFARHLDACLINVTASALYSKWMGDSNKLTTAVFSLARKMARAAPGRPVLIFIDEVDALLGSSGATWETYEQARALVTS
jgi:ATPase family AAA domain-containing protein 1